jgi:hypothetical protein
VSDYDHRNQAFDYAPPAQSGAAGGGLLVVGGLVALFVLAIMFMAPGGSPVPAENTPTPVVDTTAPAAPVPTD